MTYRTLPRRLVLAAFGAAAVRTVAAEPAPLLIAAAADLSFAIAEIAARFREATGTTMGISYGSSGNLTRQILQGAPFELFLSADEGFVFQLADAGRTLDRGLLYAEGRLVLFAPIGSPLAVDPGFAGLRAALAAGQIQRFAIANPEHAPYGRAAEQVLRGQGVWDAIKPLLVLGETVAQAAQFATSGAAQGGILAQSLAASVALAGRGSWALIPTDYHAPLRQRMVLLKNAGPAAHEFFDYLRAPATKAILRKYGFTLPNDTV